MLTLVGILLHSRSAFRLVPATTTHALVEDSTRGVKNQQYVTRFFLQSMRTRYGLDFRKTGGSTSQIQVSSLTLFVSLLPELLVYSGFIPVLVRVSPKLLVRPVVLHRFLENHIALQADLKQTRGMLLTLLVRTPQSMFGQIRYNPVQRFLV